MWTNLVPVLIYYGPAAVWLAQCTAPCTIARYRQRWREDKHIFHQQLLRLPCSHSLLSFPFSHRKPTRLSTTAEQTKLSSSGDFRRRVDEDLVRFPNSLHKRVGNLTRPCSTNLCAILSTSHSESLLQRVGLVGKWPQLCFLKRFHLHHHPPHI